MKNPRPGLFGELERRLRNDDLLSFRTVFSGRNDVKVEDHGDTLKIIVSVPGYRPGKFKWSVRVVGRTFSLKGRLQEEQSVQSDSGHVYSERKVEQLEQNVLLPCNVKERPLSVRVEDEAIILVYRKQREASHGSWRELDI